MTLSEVRKLHTDDEVYWTDPDGEVNLSKMLHISSISIDEDNVITIIDKDGSCIECFAEELS